MAEVTKRLPKPLSGLDSKQKDLFERKSDIQTVANFVNEHYTIHIPAHDPSMMMIEPKNPDRFYGPPTISNVYLHMREECEAKVSLTDLNLIITSGHYIKPFNPMLTYLHSIRGKYEGQSHIDLLCSFLKVREFDPENPEYSSRRANRIIRKWMVSTVAQWMDNVANPVMLTFVQGAGGYGKTRLTEYFIPAPLTEYSINASINGDNFDLEDAYTRYCFIIHDEMVGITRSNYESWKAITTASKLLTRRKRESVAVRRNRIAALLGTSNKNQETGGFLHELAGSRRIGCIELEDILWKEYPQVVDVDQMWAEALLLYESSDFNWQFETEDNIEMEAYNRRYLIETDATRCANLYLCHPESDEDGVWMNPREIITDLRRNGILKGDRLFSVDERRLGIALTSLGYESKKTRTCTAEGFTSNPKIPLHRYFVKRTYINNNI